MVSILQEHVIHVWEDSNPIFHNALVHQYREKYVKLLQDPQTAEERRQLRNKLLDFLDKSDHYTPETVLVHFPYDSKSSIYVIYPFITQWIYSACSKLIHIKYEH